MRKNIFTIYLFIAFNFLHSALSFLGSRVNKPSLSSLSLLLKCSFPGNILVNFFCIFSSKMPSFLQRFALPNIAMLYEVRMWHYTSYVLCHGQWREAGGMPSALLSFSVAIFRKLWTCTPRSLCSSTLPRAPPFIMWLYSYLPSQNTSSRNCQDWIPFAIVLPNFPITNLYVSPNLYEGTVGNERGNVRCPGWDLWVIKYGGGAGRLVSGKCGASI